MDMMEPRPPKPAAGWLYDDKGRVRTAACGHPLRPDAYNDVTGNPCRVCWLMAKPDEIRCYSPNKGARDRAAGKWGSSRKKRNSANSYKPGPVPARYVNDGAFPGCTTDGTMRYAVGAVLFADCAPLVAEAVARICPETSRTIRFRRGPVDDPLVIGEPYSDPSDLNGLHAMLGNFGAQAVYQQAQLSSALINFDLLNDE